MLIRDVFPQNIGEQTRGLSLHGTVPTSRTGTSPPRRKTGRLPAPGTRVNILRKITDLKPLRAGDRPAIFSGGTQLVPHRFPETSFP